MRNETATLGLHPNVARETPNPTVDLDQDTPPRKSKAATLRNRLRGVRSARRLLGEAKRIAHWRTDYEAVFALCRASDFLGRERLRLLDELEREEADW
jgi:hypothetical protein